MTSPVRFLRPASRECLVCFLERCLGLEECTGTLAFTDEWLLSQVLPARWLPDWLASRGGFCDCEVLLNAFPDLSTTVVRGLELRCS